MNLSSPFPTGGQFMINEGLPKMDDLKVKDFLTQAIYYGGIAAFFGKCFTPINPMYAATYGIIRGALDPMWPINVSGRFRQG